MELDVYYQGHINHQYDDWNDTAQYFTKLAVILEYQLSERFCLLKVAVGEQGPHSTNATLLSMTGLLLSSATTVNFVVVD